MNFTIKSKLFGGFAVLLLLLLFIATFLVVQFSTSNERMRTLINSSSRKIELSNDVIVKTMEITRLEKNFLLQDGSDHQRSIQNEIGFTITDIENIRAELNELVDNQGKEILLDFKRFWDHYLSEVEEVIALKAEGQSEEATRASLNAAEMRASANAALQQLIEKNRRDILVERENSDATFNSALTFIGVLVILSFLIAILISAWIVRSIGRRISGIAEKAEKIASREYSQEEVSDPINDELNPILKSLVSVNQSFREVTEYANKMASGDYNVALEPRSDKDQLGNGLKAMALALKEKTKTNEDHNWLTTGVNQLNNELMGNQGIEELSNNLVSFLTTYLNGYIGTIYLFNEEKDLLEIKGQYGLSASVVDQKSFRLQEGLVGQAAYEKNHLWIKEIDQDHLRIKSSLLDATPVEIGVIPFLFEERVLGVLEIGKFSSFTELEKSFIESSIESISLSVHSANARKKVQELLHETQVQSEELQSQQEELRQMNEELEEQTQNLKQQQEELQMTNEELEEQTQSLEAKNREVEAARSDIEQKTKQLEISSRYKSEFLANMSHELRTPLNSLLILSKDLFDNKLNNLNEDQVESAEIIYKSGHDLLMLINEVLDLSRIEAGKMEIHIEKIFLRSFLDSLIRDFKHQATQKGLVIQVIFGDYLPDFIYSDPLRLNQILKNLLSNAIKFTEKGSVSLQVKMHGNNTLELAVKDTGIGIKEEKQLSIFEAFQQADGGTARKYGGTGLGLSISRELAGLLNAEIRLESKLNEGSTFSLLIPVEQVGKPASVPVANAPVKNLVKTDQTEFLNYPGIEDDRDSIEKDDKIVLIIEDDLKFASILLRQAREKDFKGICAATGEDGLVLARRFTPHAIILDIDLPGMDGHQVLAQMKADSRIRHIPVHIASVNERSLEPLREGAVEYLMKPVAKEDLEEAFNRIENFVNRKMKNLLIVEDDDNSRTAIRKLIGNGDVKCLEASSGTEALEKYREHHIDCMVLDIGLPDMSGFDLIYELEYLKGKIPPIIIYTGKELTKEENEELHNYADSIIIKGVKSEERLLDETALFLHRTISNLPKTKQQIITSLYDKEAIFLNKKILVVDDDMRNVFALSKVLTDRGMLVIKAEHGKNALEVLTKNADIDMVLMDIMMPEMDGYEAMRLIRKQSHFRALPIIALTAKAMKDDKQKCIDAGANDYIPKPVDVSRLLSLMQVWLSK